MFKINLKFILLIFILPFLLGSDACQESHSFAAQSTVTTTDGPTINFVSVASSILNESGTSNINVTLSEAAEEDVTIPYTLSGTATEDSDFTITATPLSITAGSTSATITVTVVGDDLTEDDETLVITLGTPTGASLGTRKIHTVTISEEESDTVLPEITFNPSEGNIEEGNDLVIVAVLSEALDEDAEFAFTTSGTARRNDYDLDDTVVFFEAGNVEANVTLSALTDTLDDDNETVILTLSEDETQTVTLGTENVFTATIREPGSLLSAASRTISDSPTTNLGQDILEGLIALENQQNNKSIGTNNLKESNSSDCNWIGNKEDPACSDSSGSFSDIDQDGYSDQLENYLGTNSEDYRSIPPLAQSKLSDRFANVDNDLDGLSNQLELNIGTNPGLADSDSDGIKDGLEDLSESNPLDSASKPLDSDQDGVADHYEIAVGSNSQTSDSDGDGVNDGLEITLGLDPLKFDTDSDGISDFKEIQTGTDPLTADWQIP